MLAASLSLLVLQSPSLRVSAGYYTLAELGRLLQAQGHATEIAPGVQADVYALNVQRATWPELRASLVADGRLEIRRVGERWVVSRAARNLEAERAERGRFEAGLKQQMHGFFSPMALAAQEILAAPEEERSRAAARYQPARPTSPGEQALSRAAYLVSSNELPTFLLSVPTRLVAPQGSPGLDAWWQSNLKESAGLFVPSGRLSDVALPFGSLGEMSPEAQEDFARRFEVAGKIAVEPLSLTWSPRVVIGLAMPEGRIEAAWTEQEMDIGDLVPLRVPAAWRAESGPAPEVSRAEAKLPEGPLRISEVLLRTAEAAGTDLVYRVPLVNDPVLAGPVPNRLDRALVWAQEAAVAPDWGARVVRERLGEGWKWSARDPWQGAARISARKLGPVLVVRNERALLDGLAAPAVFPAAWQNGLMARRRPTMGEVAELLARWRPEANRRGGFAVADLSFGNPAGLRPFALAYPLSPTLRKAMEGGAPAEIPYSRLEPAARNALERGLVESAWAYDALPSAGGVTVAAHPLNVSSRLRGADGESLRLVVTPTGGGYEFRLEDRMTRYWVSRVQNVALSARAESR